MSTDDDTSNDSVSDDDEFNSALNVYQSCACAGTGAMLAIAASTNKPSPQFQRQQGISDGNLTYHTFPVRRDEQSDTKKDLGHPDSEGESGWKANKDDDETTIAGDVAQRVCNTCGCQQRGLTGNRVYGTINNDVENHGGEGQGFYVRVCPTRPRSPTQSEKEFERAQQAAKFFVFVIIVVVIVVWFVTCVGYFSPPPSGYEPWPPNHRW